MSVSVTRSALGLALAALVLSPACVYSLAGRSNNLPAHIRVIGVPQLVNQTIVTDLDVVLTEAVRAEFRTRRGLRVESTDQGVDGVLTGRITFAESTPAALDPTSGLATHYTITVTVAVEFKDVSNNKVLLTRPSFTVTDQYPASPGSTNDIAAYFRQNAGALERIAKQFSRTIVAEILAG